MADDDDFDDDDLDDDDEQDRGPRTPSEFAALRQQKRATKQANAENAALKRELAFTRAGLDPAKDPRLTYFIKGYEGASDPAAILEAATKAGFVTPPPTGPTPEQQQMIDAGRRIDRVGAGADDPADQVYAAYQAMDQAFAQGGNDALAAALAAQGIPQVVDGN